MLYKNRKLSAIILGLFLIVACTTTIKNKNKQATNFSPITKITNSDIYFSDEQEITSPFTNSKIETVIFLVRHAEKVVSEDKDPLLTEAGLERANRLKSILAEANMDAIYSTNYQRTQLTATPTAQSKGIAIQDYNAKDLNGFADQLKTEGVGKRILVVGHSNTTPTLTNALLGQEQFTALDESEYGHFFVVVIQENGEAKGYDFNY